MKHYVFNGDADGICATHLLAHGKVEEATLITGVKRDIGLLSQLVSKDPKEVYVLDIAIEKNLGALKDLLKQNCKITWFDHHLSEEIPEHPTFQSVIDTSPTVNTTYLVDRHLGGLNSKWTIVGLFGDNISETANRIADEISLDDQSRQKLDNLGQLFNYNAYGSTMDDLHYHPAELLKQINPFDDPEDFMHRSEVLEKLENGYRQDKEKAEKISQMAPGVLLFPDEKWSRRVIGVFANQLSQENPDRAHAILVDKGDGSFVVSVRSPASKNFSAAELCKMFPTGGGRVKAAGINKLEKDQLDQFVQKFLSFYQQS